MARPADIWERLKTALWWWLFHRGITVHRGMRAYLKRPRPSGRDIPVDLEREWVDTIERVLPFTMTTPERLAAVCSATEYIVRHEIPGSFVECGVWRGGSMMAAAFTLQRLGATDRDLYLFDTYSGMTRPTEADLDVGGHACLDHWPAPGDDAGIGAVPVPEVQAALALTGYDPARLHFVEGSVEETLPDHAPSQIALLRLDTDWYASTRHELVHLYPLLVLGGVIIIDDYGHLQGARKAADEYLGDHRILLDRIDYSGRIGVKQQQHG